MLAGGLLALALSVPAPAAAAQVEVRAPGDGARAYGKSVVMRVEAKGRNFRATADGNDVTDRFRRTGDTRRARLRLGRDFSAGRVTFVAGTGPRRHGERRTDSATVTVLRRKRSFARMNVRQRSSRHPAPFIHAHARKRLEAVRVWVNGKRVRGALETRADHKGTRGVIGAHSGLRYGHNRVVVELEHRSGVFDRERATFRIERDAPLASAGEDLQLRVGDPAVLDGTATRFARPATGAQDPGEPEEPQRSFTWKVVEAPEGSTAPLEQPADRTPTFTPDVPGHYTLRLTAADGPAMGTDEMEIVVPYSLSEVGVPMVSIAGSGDVLLGATNIRGGQPYHMVVLDESGIPLKNGGNRYFGVGGGKELLAAIKATDPGHRVLLTGGGFDLSGQDRFDPGLLEQAVVAIGGTVDPPEGHSRNVTPTPNGARDLIDGHWTVFGHRGLLEGQAVQSTDIAPSGVPGYRGGDQGQGGSLNGYLQQVDLEKLDSTSLEFVSPEAIKLDTKYDCTPSPNTLCSSATHNVVQMGIQLQQSPPIPQGALAMHLLVFGSQGTPDGGASGLPIINNESYVLNNPDGSTNLGGVEGLARRLDPIVNGRLGGPNAQPLVILQTFGAPQRPGTAPKLSPFWANDQVPESRDVLAWENGRYPTAPDDLLKIWNPRKGSNGTPAGYPTVAGLVGALTGVKGHDMVANFGYGEASVPAVGQPEPKPSTSAYEPHHELGLTVVASPHASDPGSAYVKRQTDPCAPTGTQPCSPLDGSAVGTLRRNNQGQFELTNPSLAPGFLYRPTASYVPFDTGGLWDLAFQPATPFPCSVEQPAPCSSPDAALAVMKYVAGQAFPSTVNVRDVRSLYVSEGDEFDAPSLRPLQDTVMSLKYPGGNPGFTPADLEYLKRRLGDVDGEFEQVSEVRRGIESWQDLLTAGQFAGFVNAQAITENIVDVVLKDEEEAKVEAEIDAKEATSDGLLEFSEVAEIAIIGLEVGGAEVPGLSALPSVVGAVAEGIDFAGSVTPEDQSVAVAHDEEQIRVKASQIGQEINDRVTRISDNLFKLGHIFVTDPSKLARASQNFTNGLVWTYGDNSKIMQGRATIVSTSRELYEGLMPLAFDLAVVSPHRTGDEAGKDGENTDGPLDDLRTYNCTKVVDNPEGSGYVGDGTLNPFDRSARSGFHTLHHRRQDGPHQGDYPRESGTAAQIGLALKGNKAKFNVQDIDGEEIGIRNRGSDPPNALTDPLFRIPASGDGARTVDSLRMSKDEFFAVDRWDTKKIECG